MLLDKGKAQTEYKKGTLFGSKDRRVIEPGEVCIGCLNHHSNTPVPMQVGPIIVVIMVFFLFGLITIFARFFSHPLAG